MRRITAVVTPVAHLVGPGKVEVVNGQLAYSTGEGTPLRLDPRALRAMYCYGPVGVTDEALQVLFQHEVEVAWLTPAGTRCRGRLVRSNPSRTGLRLLQHRVLARTECRLEWARRVVAAKITSAVDAARHHQRHGVPEAGAVLQRLQSGLDRCSQAASGDEVRGIEGNASAAWFDLLGVVLGPPWNFRTRTRRPPTDPVNALLSLGYTWVLARAAARCEAAGLELYLGGLHEYRPGRPSLACDLMEPLRVPAVDRWVIRVLREGRFAPADFREEDGGFRLQPGRFAPTLRQWEEHWLSTSMEARLDSWVQQFEAWLRQQLPEGPAIESADEAL